MKTIKAILQALAEANLSQSEISRRTSIPQPRLSRWAAGENSSSADDAIKLRLLLDEVRKPARRRSSADGEVPA